MLTSDWLVSPPSLAFEGEMSKFYHERIPKAGKMKTIPTSDVKLHEGDIGWRMIRVYEAGL